MREAVRKRLFALLLCLTLLLSACGKKSVEAPGPTPIAEGTATPDPTPSHTPTSEPESTPEEVTELWGFPIDDTHDAFEVPTGGKLGTVLVTVEMKDEEPVSVVSVWNPFDLEAPIQTIETEGVTTHCYELMDANFDGYMDSVYTWFRGAKNNDSGLYVWDEEQGQFMPKKEFIGDLVIDGEKNRIYIYTNGAGPSGIAKIFCWESKELFLKRIIDFPYPETLEDGTIQQEIVVEDIVDGEWREVYREAYNTPDEVASIMEAYYSGELLWYDLSYHGE